MLSQKELQQYLVEVESTLQKIESSDKPPMWKSENYVGAGQSKLRFLDLKLPLVREVYKKGFSFSKLTPAEQWKIWDYIWQKSPTFDVMNLASFWADSRPTAELIEHEKLIWEWIHRVDNWAHSDSLSAHYSRMLESNHKKYLPTFERWLKASQPWLRRQALVGLLFYSRLRKKVLPVKKILGFVSTLMKDEHFYVQKGVGWTLRECWNLYPKETYAYLERHAAEIPPAGWTAATEKLSATQKKKLMKLRKAKKLK